MKLHSQYFLGLWLLLKVVVVLLLLYLWMPQEPVGVLSVSDLAEVDWHMTCGESAFLHVENFG